MGKYRVIGLPPISLVINQGEHIIIRGNNGCGKSTLLKIISSLIRKSTGSIEFHMKAQSTNALKHMIGYIPEQVDFDQSMTPFSFWKMACGLRKISPNNERFNYYMKHLKLHKWIKQPIGSFSLGMKKRVLLAIWMSLDIKFLLLDEFESGLDQDAATLVKNLFEENADLTILAISHNHRSPVFEKFLKYDFVDLLDEE